MILKNFPTMTTDRLRLRQLTLADEADIFEVFSEEEVMRFYGMDALEEKPQAGQMIQYFRNGFEEGRAIRWAIELMATGKVIGTCGYHNIHALHSRAEVGYELNKNYWRQGYITEALKAVFVYGFQNLKLNRIEGQVYTVNEASQKCLESLGFTKEGVARQYARYRGQFEDLVIYSLLKEDMAIESLEYNHVGVTPTTRG